MAFVYLLSYNGIPFYVGITSSLVKRYIKHYKVRDCTSYDPLHKILCFHGNYVDIIPLFYGLREQAVILETQTIIKLSNANIPLANRMHNKPDNRIPEEIIKYNKPRFPKELKNKLMQLETHI